MIELIFIGFYIIQSLLIIYITKKLWYAFTHFKMKQLLSPARSIDELPSVSVCIPARNETHAMTRCLESVLASTYPKMEVIVLDDSSSDDTSYLIKSFAHAGVRFVQGKPLPDGWLGKNHALEMLLQEASGRYVLYMDVDTHIKPDTISQLMSYVAQENAAMVSVLPQRNDSWRVNVLFSTLRYFWELVLHRKSRPAVASAAWIIERKVLKDTLAGFASWKLDVQPEKRIADILGPNNGYRFLIGTALLGVNYEKKWSSQVETAIRLLYPRFGGRWLPGVMALGLMLLLWSPHVIVLTALLYGWTPIHSLVLIHALSAAVLYGWYVAKTRKTHRLVGVLVWPIIILQEAVLMMMSMLGYALGTITWKGRPVTSPKVVRQVEQSTADA